MENWFDTWFNTPYYHLLYKDRNVQEADFFLNNLLTYLKPLKTDRFLDIACGKGRHAVSIHQKGFTVEGIDLSSKSIDYANTFSEKGLSFSCHDMRQIYKREAFHYVLNLFTSFGYFNSKEENQKAINAMAANLKKGGKVIIDFMNSKKVIHELVKHDIKKVEHISFDINRKVTNGLIIKDIRFQDQNNLYHFQERVQALELLDFMHFFEKAGLKIINLWGDYSLNDFDTIHSPRLILLAQK